MLAYFRLFVTFCAKIYFDLCQLLVSLTQTRLFCTLETPGITGGSNAQKNNSPKRVAYNLIEWDRLHKDAAELYKERCEDQGNDGDQFD